jgi:hypothetical protein
MHMSVITLVCLQEINYISILLIEFGCTVLSHSSVKFTYKLESERKSDVRETNYIIVCYSCQASSLR